MSKRPFAEGTSVPASRSQAEIRDLITRYGADGFAFAEWGERARIEFKAHGRRCRFELPMPDAEDARFAKRGHGRRSSAERTNDAYAAEVRRLWRCLVLCIKSKLEVVETGMAIFEEEFLANIVLPDGRTAGEHVVPAIATAYESGRVAGLLGTGA